MKKLKSKAGLTLMEMMAALLVMVLLVVGMGTGMDAGMRVYRESKFETDCAAMGDIMNTSISDLLRYAQNIRKDTVTSDDGTKDVFSNPEFGILDGYIQLSENGIIQLKSLNGSAPIDLVNMGAYRNLIVDDFRYEYITESTEVPTDDESAKVITVEHLGFFYVFYTVKSENDSAKTRDFVAVVRPMNSQ